MPPWKRFRGNLRIKFNMSQWKRFRGNFRVKFNMSQWKSVRLDVATGRQKRNIFILKGLATALTENRIERDGGRFVREWSSTL